MDVWLTVPADVDEGRSEKILDAAVDILAHLYPYGNIDGQVKGGSLHIDAGWLDCENTASERKLAYDVVMAAVNLAATMVDAHDNLMRR